MIDKDVKMQFNGIIQRIIEQGEFEEWNEFIKLYAAALLCPDPTLENIVEMVSMDKNWIENAYAESILSEIIDPAIHNSGAIINGRYLIIHECKTPEEYYIEILMFGMYLIGDLDKKGSKYSLTDKGIKNALNIMMR